MRTAIVIVDSDDDDLRRIKENVFLHTYVKNVLKPGKQHIDGCVVYKHIGYVNMFFLIIPETHPLYNVGLIGISILEIAEDTTEGLAPIIDGLVTKYS